MLVRLMQTFMMSPGVVGLAGAAGYRTLVTMSNRFRKGHVELM